jgi:GntR family histidine utilization transcriptional repressor
VQRRTWSDQGAVTFVRFTYPAALHAIVATFTPAASDALARTC